MKQFGYLRSALYRNYAKQIHSLRKKASGTLKRRAQRYEAEERLNESTSILGALLYHRIPFSKSFPDCEFTPPKFDERMEKMIDLHERLGEIEQGMRLRENLLLKHPSEARANSLQDSYKAFVQRITNIGGAWQNIARLSVAWRIVNFPELYPYIVTNMMGYDLLLRSLTDLSYLRMMTFSACPTSFDVFALIVHMAVKNDPGDTVTVLLKHGRDTFPPQTKQVDTCLLHNGNSLIHTAVSYKNLKLIDLFKEQADVNHQNRRGDTPLYLAAGLGDREPVAALLTSRTIRPEMRCSGGDTALHQAARSGYTNVINTLLAHSKININIRDNDGSTPLHIAVSGGEIHAAKCLISNGADTTIVNRWGRSAFSFARSENIKLYLQTLLLQYQQQEFSDHTRIGE